MNAITDLPEGKNVAVADWVLRYPGASSVFKKNKIDFCCGGQHTLQDACVQAGLDPDKILSSILESQPEESEALRVDNWWRLYCAT